LSFMESETMKVAKVGKSYSALTVKIIGNHLLFGLL